MPDTGVRRITWRTADVARTFSLAILFFFLWTFFWMVHNALFLGLIAVLMAIVIHAPARLLSRWIPFRIAFGLSVAVFLGAFAWLVITLVPQIAQQISQLATQIPETIDSVVAKMEREGTVAPGGGLAGRINEQLGEFAGRFLPLAINLISTALGSLAVVVLAIFLAAQPEVYRSMLLRVIPPEKRERAARIYDEAGGNLRTWIVGKVVTMIFMGIVTYIGLTLFGIPGALALAMLAALMEFIPNFGPTIAALPAMAAAFAISPMLALYVAVFYFVLQQIQNALTVPLVERRAVNIPAAALLAWQLMLAIGFGILALFVATPLLAILVVVVRIAYLEPAEELRSWDRREAGAQDVPSEGEPPALPAGA